MKIIENITIYKCDFCRKKLERNHAMEKHENTCVLNPKNKKECNKGCIHLSMVDIKIPFNRGYDDINGEERQEFEKKSVFKCSKFDKLMYPYKIESKNLPYKYPDTYEGQVAMPKDCDGFWDGLFFDVSKNKC